MELPVYVIHARHLTRRRDRIERHLHWRLGLPLTWVTELDPADIDAATDARSFRSGHKLTPAEKSCVLKHLSAARRLVESGAPVGLVVEDDIFLRLFFRRRLRRVLAELSKGPDAAVAALSCGSNYFVPRHMIERGRMLYPASKCRTTDLYLLTRAAAETRLAYASTHKIALPADHHFNECDAHAGISMFWSHPHLAMQLSVAGLMESSVAGHEKALPKSPWGFFRRGLKRRFFSGRRRAT